MDRCGAPMYRHHLISIQVSPWGNTFNGAPYGQPTVIDPSPASGGAGRRRSPHRQLGDADVTPRQLAVLAAIGAHEGVSKVDNQF